MERTQFILVAMDATPRGDLLEENAFQKFFARVHTVGNASFTLFINTGYLQLRPTWTPPAGSVWSKLPEAQWRQYVGKLPLNLPAIDYANDPDEIQRRAANVLALNEQGVEFGSHTVRHLHGLHWSVAQWRTEFAEHRQILDLLKLPRPRGIRAPFLEYNDNFFTALADEGLLYDSSRPHAGKPAWPVRVAEGRAWSVGVPVVKLLNGKRALFFDLNLRNNFHVSEDEYYKVAMQEFIARYHGARAPFMLSGHGNYLAPTARFLREVCALAKVRCGTFSELVEYMNQHPELAGAQ